MSDTIAPPQDFNPNTVLIAGESGVGKSMSLRNLKQPEGVLYLNCEVGKPLPFRPGFRVKTITDPAQIFEEITKAESDQSIHTVVIDTVTFMMDMYETQYIVPASDTRAAWGNYAQFWKQLMYSLVAPSKKRFIFLAHNLELLDAKDSVMKTSVPVKGSLRNQGIEAWFTTVVYAQKRPIHVLDKYPNDLLKVTDKERLLKFKHVFQTQITEDTIYSRIRSPMGLFTDEETFIDNDAEQLMQRIAEYFQSPTV